MGASGFRPLVTAWVITARRFSLSFCSSACFLAISASIWSVFQSRKAAICCCSAYEGNGKTKFLMASWPMFCMEPLAPVASCSYWNLAARVRKQNVKYAASTSGLRAMRNSLSHSNSLERTSLGTMAALPTSSRVLARLINTSPGRNSYSVFGSSSGGNALFSLASN